MNSKTILFIYLYITIYKYERNNKNIKSPVR